MPARLWLWSIGVAAGVVMLASAAGMAEAGGRAQTVAQVDGGTLRVGEPFSPLTLDPAISYSTEFWGIEFATCAKLYSFPDAPGSEGAIVIPEVAKDVPKVSSDGRTNTIVLKRTFRFQTGERVNAASFVAAFNRDANPKLHSPAASYLHDIAGADSVLRGQASVINGVQALGRYTLRIRTTRPLADLASRLTMPFFCPVPAGTPPREIELPPGSGPYYVASHVPNRQLVLKRNPFYGGDRHPHVAQIIWTIGVRGEACRVAVERDELDFCGILGVPSADYSEIAHKYGINRPGGRFFFNPTLTSGGLIFNHDRPAFKGAAQIPLKQAINWAIDRRALVAAYGYLGGKRTDQILPSALARTASIYPLGVVTQASLARARALIAKAKFEPTTLVLYALNDPTDIAQSQIIQYDLNKVGVGVEVKYFSFAELFARAGKRGEPYDLILFDGTSPDYPDPGPYFAQLTGGNISNSPNPNWAFFDRPFYNRRIAAIDRLQGRARRIAWANLDVDLMRNDPPWATFGTPARRDFVSQSFGCFIYLPGLDNVDLVAACKK